LNSSTMGFSMANSNFALPGGGYGGGAGGFGALGGRAGTGTSASLFPGISNTNPFGSYFANPLAIGLTRTSTTSGLTTGVAGQGSGFGRPLYVATTSTSSTGLTGTTGGTTSATSSNIGYGSFGVRRVPDTSWAMPVEQQMPAPNRPGPVSPP